MDTVVGSLPAGTGRACPYGPGQHQKVILQTASPNSLWQEAEGNIWYVEWWPGHLL